MVDHSSVEANVFWICVIAPCGLLLKVFVSKGSTVVKLLYRNPDWSVK